MACNMKTDVLERFLDDDLDPTECATIRGHIEHCTHCEKHVNDVLLVRNALQESTAQQVSNAPLDKLWERIEHELDREPAETKPITPPMGDKILAWWHSIARPWAVASAVSALGVVLGIWALHSPNSHTDLNANPDTANHAFVMESYEVSDGTVIIDVDPEGSVPAVVWHFIDEEEGRI